MPKPHLALVGQPKTGAINFRGVVLPYKPPIDKIAALCVLVYKNGQALETIEYWKQNDCPAEQFADWRDSGIYPIDVGDRKYHDSGVGSATEFVSKEFGIESPGIRKLVELINRNNKTGSLKDFQFSVAFMLRELYELTDDQNQHMEVINNAADVVQAFIRVENGEHGSVDGIEDALPDLVEQFQGCNYSPMTLGRYMRDLWLLGNEPDVIREKVQYWLDNYEQVRERLLAGEAALEKLDPIVELIAGTTCVALVSDDRFLAKALIKSRKHGMRILVTPKTGHTVISTSGYDLGKLAERLQEKEPGRWFYQAKMGALINGGPQYIGVPATEIGFKQLMGLMKALVQPKKPKVNPIKR